jgi:hypothetical protein
MLVMVMVRVLSEPGFGCVDWRRNLGLVVEMGEDMSGWKIRHAEHNASSASGYMLIAQQCTRLAAYRRIYFALGYLPSTIKLLRLLTTPTPSLAWCASHPAHTPKNTPGP